MKNKVNEVHEVFDVNGKYLEDIVVELFFEFLKTQLNLEDI